MIKPYDFVGYWGYGNQQELDNFLSKILSGVTVKQFSKHQQDNCIWGVGYINLAEPFTEVTNIDGVIASLSAAGLHENPDAWVKLEDDCLILGREAFGRVPLYWTKQEKIIWFASRLQLLLPLLETPQISIPGLYGYSCFSYVPTPLTPVENISAVTAGEELRFSGKTLTQTSQRLLEWRESPQLIRDEAEAIAQLQTLLKDAIHRQIQQLPSEPVGIFLSGGIDSSVVAALLVQAGVKVRAYALDFELILANKRFNEFPYAQQVAQFLNIELVKVSVAPQKIRQAIAATAQALDLPFGDGAPLPLFLLSQVASQETSVIFNGENGDQLFAGWTNKPMIAAGMYNSQNPTGAKSFGQQYIDTFQALFGYEAQCFQPNIYSQIQNLDPQNWLESALDPSCCSNLLARLRRATLMLKGAQNIQPRANNLALSQGLWVRSPFCDIPLSEWAFQLPGELVLSGVCEKYILKRAVESWLPPEIVWREKQGMAVPVTTLCLNALRKDVRNWLSPSRLQQGGIWQPQLPFKVINGEIGGNIRGGKIGRILWLLMMWQAWESQFLGKDNSNISLERLLYDAYYFPPFKINPIMNKIRW